MGTISLNAGQVFYFNGRRASEEGSTIDCSSRWQASQLDFQEPESTSPLKQLDEYLAPG